MKRIILGLALALGITAYAQPAAAATLKVREIGWATNSATTLNPVYTIRKGSNGTLIDTTMNFSLIDVSCPEASLQGTAGKDSITIAYVRFRTDTTVAVTNTLSTVSYVIEGSGDGNTWSALVTNASNAIVASGDQFFSIPLWYNSGTGNGTTGVKTSPLLTAPLLRIRFTASTGNFFAARCELVYWGRDLPGNY